MIERIEVDTADFRGNYPDRFSMQAARVDGGTEQSVITQSMFWPTLIGETPLSMDAEHVFSTGIYRAGRRQPCALTSTRMAACRGCGCGAASMITLTAAR